MVRGLSSGPSQANAGTSLLIPAICIAAQKSMQRKNVHGIEVVCGNLGAITNNVAVAYDLGFRYREFQAHIGQILPGLFVARMMTVTYVVLSREWLA